MPRTKEEIINRLEQLQSTTALQWREHAEQERKNRSWLRHSQYIAVCMLGKMRENHITQKQLAEHMGCSQQYVCKILKGKENLSLETIAKIEDALQLSIISSPHPYFIPEPEISIVAENS